MKPVGANNTVFIVVAITQSPSLIVLGKSGRYNGTSRKRAEISRRVDIQHPLLEIFLKLSASSEEQHLQPASVPAIGGAFVPGESMLPPLCSQLTPLSL